jgi:putative SOS response-associated peptidase YedK
MEIHDRMPVILNREEQITWLDNDSDDLDSVRVLMKPYRGKDLEAYVVSTYVNNPANEGAQCIVRVPSLLDYFDSS